MGSGNAPLSFSYKSFHFHVEFMDNLAIRSLTLRRALCLVPPLGHPGAITKCFLPSQHNCRHGSRKTSVLTFFGSIPGPFQKLVGLTLEEIDVDHPVQFRKGLPCMTCIRTAEHAGFMPRQMRPENFPLHISSNMIIHEAF